MAKTVVGLYDTEAAAREAAHELEKNGFGDLPIYVEAEGAADARFTHDGNGNLGEALREAGVPEDDATFYIEGVQRGGGLLILEAPDERAEDAVRLMNLHEPIRREREMPEGEGEARKRARERSETIRETEIDVEEIGAGFREHADEFRTHYESAYGDTDSGYEAYEPAYRFGYAYGSHEDFAGRSYADVEPDLRRDYERKHGQGMFERVTDAVRHAYNRVRR